MLLRSTTEHKHGERIRFWEEKAPSGAGVGSG